MQYRYYTTLFTDAVRVFPGALFVSANYINEVSDLNAIESDYSKDRIPDSAALLVIGRVL